MTVRKLIQRLLRATGLEVQRFRDANIEQVVLKNVLGMTKSTVILDVGANIGQFGDLALATGFRGTLVSFEAIPSVHQQLTAHASKKRSSWVIAPCTALGSRRGEIEINVSANSVSSSILAMRSTHLEAAPESKYVAKKTVPIERLDELAPRIIPPMGRIYIKVDTQGYEMEVLKGATALLPRAAAIQLELSLIPLYFGAPTFVEMIAFVESMGYELFGIVPGFKNRQTGRLLQADAFFVRNVPPSA